MFAVIFKNSKGEERTIGMARTKDAAFKVIDDFLADHNYKSYYKRTWNTDDKTTIVDVGSWTERFILQDE